MVKPDNEWTNYDQEQAVARAIRLFPDGPAYPDDNPKTALGVAKPSMHGVPPVALLHLGSAMADGVRKYGLTNWRDKPVSSSTYYDAALRHLLAWWDGESLAADSGAHHLAHVMACCAILLDAEGCATLNDNRPSVPGPAGRFIAEKTETPA